MTKTLVYLDQNYLSNLAKAATGAGRVGHSIAERRSMSELLQLLRELVDRDRVLCPASTVHEQETSFDSRLEGAIHGVLKELSDGVSFRNYREIEFLQTLRALRRYLGMETEPEDGRWQHAFVRNPHLSIERPRVYVHMPWPAAFADDDRKRKANMLAFSEKQLLLHARQPPATFAECRRGQMMGVVKLAFLDPLVKHLQRVAAVLKGAAAWPTLSTNPSGEEIIDYFEAVTAPIGMKLLQKYSALIGAGNLTVDERFLAFFQSPEFDAIPYYDIFCSLNAGFLYYKPERRPMASDPYDMAALRERFRSFMSIIVSP